MSLFQQVYQECALDHTTTTTTGFPPHGAVLSLNRPKQLISRLDKSILYTNVNHVAISYYFMCLHFPFHLVS